MVELRIKIKQGQTEIELEGEGDIVLKIFNELRNDGLGHISNIENNTLNPKNQIDTMDFVKSELEKDESFKPDYSEAQAEVQAEVQADRESLPTINSLALTMEMSTEKLWTLVYCLYEDVEGNKTITTKNITQKYIESNRYKKTITKNNSTNLKNLVKEGYLDAVSKNEYRLSKNGNDYAIELIRNKGKVKNSNVKSKKNRIKKVHNYQLVEIDITSELKDELKNYWEMHNHKSAQDKVTLIGYWLEKNTSITQFCENEIFTVLKSLKESTNFDIAAALRNAKTFKNHLKDSGKTGYYCVTHIVDEFISDQLKS